MDKTPASDILSCVLEYVTSCREADPLGDYLHVGDIQWWFRGGELDDPTAWRFCLDGTGDLIGVGLAEGGEITSIVHPKGKDSDVLQEIRAWGLGRLVEEARRKSLDAYEISETAVDDDLAKVTMLVSDGYSGSDSHLAKYKRSLKDELRMVALPPGFCIRGAEGAGEATARAALHLDSFGMRGYQSIEEATSRFHRILSSPTYDPYLDLVAVSSDGELAASSTFWLDTTNKVALLEPLCTHPNYRRKGLGTALVLEGLRRSQQKGATTALVSANHPEPKDADPTDPFSSSRFVFEQVGFQLQRREYTFQKTIDISH